MELTKETIKQVAEKYGLTVEIVEDKEKAGFYIDGEKIRLKDIFTEIFLFDNKEE